MVATYSKPHFWMIVFSMLVIENIFCQTMPVKGIVCDDANNPIPYASVVFSSDSLSNKMLEYAVTDNDGRFSIDKLSAEISYRWVCVRSMGYETYLKKLPLSKLLGLNIVLSESANELNEFVVTAQRPDVVKRGDTLVYNSSQFAKGDEQNIGDVIQKMPGMEVDDTGNVSFLGRKIEKLLIDGDDVLAGSSSSAIKTFSPDFANSIELISNYSDGSIENKFKQDGALALNLKSGKKTKINGTLEASAGFNEKYKAKSSIITLVPKLSLNTMLNMNNTGEAAFSIQEYFANVVGFSNIKSGEQASLSEVEKQLLFPPENEYARAVALANLNALWKPSDKYRLKTNTIYNKTESKGLNAKTDKYTLPSQTFTNNSTADFQKTPEIFSQILLQDWRPSSVFSIKMSTKIDISKNTALNAYSDQYTSISINAAEDFRQKQLKLSQVGEANMLIGKGLLSAGIHLDAERRNFCNKMKIKGALPLPIQPWGQSNDTLFYSQNKDGAKTSLNTFASITHPILRDDMFIKVELSYKMDMEETSITNHVPHLLSDAKSDKIEARLWKTYAGMVKNNGLFRFSGGVSAATYNFATNLDFKQEKHIYWEPNINIEFFMSAQHRLRIALNHTYSPFSMEYLTSNVWMTGYKQVQLGSSEISNPLRNIQRANLSYQYASLFDRFMLFVFSDYSKVKNAQLLSVNSDGLITFNSYKDGGLSETYYNKIYLNKGLGSLPFDVKSTGVYSYNKSNILRANTPESLHYKEFSATLDIISKFRQSPFNFEIGTRYSNAQRTIKPSNINSMTREKGILCKLFYNKGNMSFSISGKSSHINEGDVKRRFDDVDFLAKYKFKKIELKATGENIFHLSSNEWTKEVLLPNLISSISYRRMTGNILFSVAYNL